MKGDVAMRANGRVRYAIRRTVLYQVHWRVIGFTRRQQSDPNVPSVRKDHGAI